MSAKVNVITTGCWSEHDGQLHCNQCPWAECTAELRHAKIDKDTQLFETKEVTHGHTYHHS